MWNIFPSNVTPPSDVTHIPFKCDTHSLQIPRTDGHTLRSAVPLIPTSDTHSLKTGHMLPSNVTLITDSLQTSHDRRQTVACCTTRALRCSLKTHSGHTSPSYVTHIPFKYTRQKTNGRTLHIACSETPTFEEYVRLVAGTLGVEPVLDAHREADMVTVDIG